MVRVVTLLGAFETSDFAQRGFVPSLAVIEATETISIAIRTHCSGVARVTTICTHKFGFLSTRCFWWQLKFGVPIITIRTLHAQTGKVIRTHSTAYMPIIAVRTMLTETTVIPGTVSYPVFGFDVEIWTLRITAFSEIYIKMTWRHFGAVHHVKELALIVLFTQPTQPVFAYH